MEVVRPSVKVERKFHEAGISWAQKELYKDVWLPFHWTNKLVKSVVSDEFYQRHFTTYARYQDAVIQAVARNNLPELDKSLDQLVGFIDKKSKGFKTFDLSDNRALLLFTAHEEILPQLTSRNAFEKAFYNRVVQTQANPKFTNGIGVLQDFDAIVHGIHLIYSDKTLVQIQHDASLAFGEQVPAHTLRQVSDLLLKNPTMSQQRNKEEIQINICDKAEILVNCSKPLTVKDVQETLGEDFCYINDPKTFIAALETMRTAKTDEATRIQAVKEATQASAEAASALKQAAADIEALEEEYITRIHNPGLYDTFIDPVLMEIDDAIVPLKDLSEEAVKKALGNREGLIDDISNFTNDLKTIIQAKRDANQALSDYEKSKVKLCIRNHFTLDKPIGGSLMAFLVGKRSPLDVNPTSDSIKDYLVWRAGKESQEKLLTMLTKQRDGLLQNQEKERQQLTTGVQNTQFARSQQLNDDKQKLSQARENDPANKQLETLLKDWKFLLKFPVTLKDADNLKLEARNWAAKVANEIYDTNSGDKALSPQAIIENKKNLVQLTEEIPAAISAWIKVETKYLADVESAAEAWDKDIAKIEQSYQDSLAKMVRKHQLNLTFHQTDIDECTATIAELKGNIKRSDESKNHPHNHHKLTPDYVCDLALRLNISDDRLSDIGINTTKLKEYKTAAIKVHHCYEAQVASGLSLIEAKLDLDKYHTTLLEPTMFTIQNYLSSTQTTLESFVKETTTIVVPVDKNLNVKDRVRTIFEHMILDTWDEKPRLKALEEMWKKEAATRLLELVGKISHPNELHPADVELLRRARQFASQVQLTSDQKTAIKNADIANSKSWDKATIDAYGDLIGKCRSLINDGKLRLEPVADEVEEPRVAPKNEEKEEEEIPLIRSKKAASNRYQKDEQG